MLGHDVERIAVDHGPEHTERRGVGRVVRISTGVVDSGHGFDHTCEGGAVGKLWRVAKHLGGEEQTSSAVKGHHRSRSGPWRQRHAENREGVVLGCGIRPARTGICVPLAGSMSHEERGRDLVQTGVNGDALLVQFMLVG
jgi:hypothetical protein